MSDPKGLYAVLEASPGCSEEELKRAYKKVAFRWHPDKNPDDPEATAKFQAISNAWQVLQDPLQRRKYDETGLVGDEANSDFGHAVDLEEMMEMFAAMFGGAMGSDVLDMEIAELLGAGGGRRRRRGKLPQRLRTAAAPGARAPRSRGGRLSPDELLLEEMLFGGGPGVFMPGASAANPFFDDSDDEGEEDAAAEKQAKPRGRNQPQRPKKAKGKRK